MNIEQVEKLTGDAIQAIQARQEAEVALERATQIPNPMTAQDLAAWHGEMGCRWREALRAAREALNAARAEEQTLLTRLGDLLPERVWLRMGGYAIGYVTTYYDEPGGGRGKKLSWHLLDETTKNGEWLARAYAEGRVDMDDRRPVAESFR
jgi:hypothetical protein